MLAVLVLPLLVAALAGLGAPLLRDRLRPSVAARLLPVVVLALAGSAVVSAVALAVVVGARWETLAAVGRWSVRALPWACHAVSPGIGAAVGGLALLGLGNAARTVLGIVRDTHRLHRLWDTLPPGPPGTRLMADGTARAFSVLGLRDRVVLSTGLLDVLGPREVLAVIAHEQAHRRRHHHLASAAVAVAGAAVPVLRPLAALAAHAAEREADEDAAVALGDRRVVAAAVARVGLAGVRARPGVPIPALGAGGGRVPARVEALLRPPPTRRTRAVVVLVAVLTISAALTLTNAVRADHSIDHARTVYTASVPVGPALFRVAA